MATEATTIRKVSAKKKQALGWVGGGLVCLGAGWGLVFLGERRRRYWLLPSSSAQEAGLAPVELMPYTRILCRITNTHISHNA